MSTTSKVESYVDHSKLYLAFSNKGTDAGLEALQHDLQLVPSWCCANQVLCFGYSQMLRRTLVPFLVFQSKDLAPIDAGKNFWVVIAKHLSFYDHCLASFWKTLRNRDEWNTPTVGLPFLNVYCECKCFQWIILFFFSRFGHAQVREHCQASISSKYLSQNFIWQKEIWAYNSYTPTA